MARRPGGRAVVAAVWLGVAVLAVSGCGRRATSSALRRVLACPAGVIARTSGPRVAFTAGWVRLVLQPCAGAPPGAVAGRLEVEGGDRALVFSPGRAGCVTAGLLTGSDAPARAPVQAFLLPRGSGASREVVLAPWPGPSPPPRLAAIALSAPAR